MINTKTMLCVQTIPLHSSQTMDNSEEVINFCWKGEIKEVDRLIRNDPSIINRKIEFGYRETTILHVAALSGHTEVVDYLLSQGASVDAKEGLKETPLHCAAGNGHLDVVNLLISRGALVDAKNSFGETPLHCASGYKRADVAHALITNGASVDAKDTWGDTPLHNAAKRGHSGTVKVLLKYIDPAIITNGKNDKNETPFTLAYKWERPKVVKLLLEHVISIERRENATSEIAELEDKSGHLQLISGVIPHSASPELTNTRTDLTKALLLTAWRKGYTDCIRILISHVNSVDIRDRDGYTLLHWAAKKGNVEITKALLSHQSSSSIINAEDNLQRTPLKVAWVYYNVRIVHLLVKNGADICVKDFFGNTVLHWAAQIGNVELIKSLLKHKNVGDIINSENNKSETPLILANSVEVSTLLEQASHTFLDSEISESRECLTSLHSKDSERSSGISLGSSWSQSDAVASLSENVGSSLSSWDELSSTLATDKIDSVQIVKSGEKFTDCAKKQ